MPNETFYKNLRKELEDKKKIAKDLEDAIKFGEETGNLDPNAKQTLVAANTQIKKYEAALKARGY